MENNETFELAVEGKILVTVRRVDKPDVIPEPAGKGLIVCYEWHDDSKDNPVKTAIQNALPEILIDNTPGGLWGSPTLASEYSKLGIKVFSYISGGYEGRGYSNAPALLLEPNLARIPKIKADGCAGVFLDEVSSHPGTEGKAYIQSISDECRKNGLQLILNTGVSVFDTWLMSACDYLMTDEHYAGRKSTDYESLYLDRILLASLGVANAEQGATLTKAAYSQGFKFHYPCDSYVVLPKWLLAYLELRK